MDKPEALRLADELDDIHTTHVARNAAAELRRLHAERTAADGVINDLVAKVRELQKENTSLSAALASSCDEQRHELWESGGIAGCERARVAERQRDALLEALKLARPYINPNTLDGYYAEVKADAAINAVEEGK